MAKMMLIPLMRYDGVLVPRGVIGETWKAPDGKDFIFTERQNLAPAWIEQPARPQELDVPHWARERVDNSRQANSYSAAVTDRMIFAALSKLSPTDVCDYKAMMDLREWDKTNGAPPTTESLKLIPEIKIEHHSGSVWHCEIIISGYKHVGADTTPEGALLKAAALWFADNGE